MKPRSSSLISFEQQQQLISDIYDAALEPDQWGNVLEKLAHTLKAEQANLRIINTELNEVPLAYWYNKDPHWNQLYKEHYIHKDLWLNNIMKARDTFIACTHHHISNKEYEKLEFHGDFVSPQKIHYGMGGKINIGKNMTGFITFSRDRNKQGFEDAYLKTLLQLVAHLQKALLINEKTQHIELKQNLLSDALDQINNPLLLVDKNGKILFINRLAEQLTEHLDGINIKDNCIFISSHTERKKLQSLIHQATLKGAMNIAKQGGMMYYTNPLSRSSLSILVSPISPDRSNIDMDSANDKMAIVLLSTNSQQMSLSAELLTGLYNLTPAEARLTLHLCQGLTLDEISEKLFLSKNTLRTQLRSSFKKTGVSRQAELIRLVTVGATGIINMK